MSDGLAWAIKNGDIDEVKQFVNIKNINSTFERRTALHYAADYGQYEVAAWLLSMGADVNAIDEFGIAPLLAAVWESHVPVIQLLVDKGANREIKAPNGTPLIDCTESEDVRNILLA